MWDARACGIAGAGLLLLIATVMTNRYRLDALPLRPHLEHVAIFLVGIVLLVLFWQKKARLAFQWSDALLALYLGVALGSSLLFPLAPRASVEYWLRMLLAIVVYFLARGLFTAMPLRNGFRLAIKALLIFGVVEALFGITSWALYPFGVNLGVDEYPLGPRGPDGILCTFSLTMYGTLWEPNVFGSTLVAVFLVGATLFVSNEFRAWRKFLGFALTVILTALALNASRGAFLALALGLVLIVLFANGMNLWQKFKWAAAAFGVLALVFVPSQQGSPLLMNLPSAPGLAQRAPCAEWIAAGMPAVSNDEYVAPDSESGLTGIARALEGHALASRWVAYKQAWDDFVQRPIFGNGANSFGQKYTTTAHTPGWISNLLLMSLHDTGMVGTMLLLAWCAWFAWRAFRAWQRTPQSAARTMLLAVGIALLCLFAAYQVTTMLWFGLIWFWFAIVEQGKHAAESQTAP